MAPSTPKTTRLPLKASHVSPKKSPAPLKRKKPQVPVIMAALKRDAEDKRMVMLDEVEDGLVELEDSDKTLVQSEITVDLPKVYPAKIFFDPTLLQFVEELQGKLETERKARAEMADLWVRAEENCRKTRQDWALLLKRKRQIQKECEDLKLELSALKEENDGLKGVTEALDSAYMQPT
ncbi:hypothetical protein K435DRAFT_863733 [Dendrothele bispora CBS 962.96]|uniref:Uncharacterized protein n=1 Tax=Dendrothele bispora (strain CBS 962.96) TaxID=1314807 RepID=A0A4S8LP04_DENBC|nr:hypothetical protein K435DRAFT_863733 [Dendrothele bispora CBS 962.96]